MSCPCGNPDCLPGQTDLPLEDAAHGGQSGLNPEASTEGGSIPPSSATPDDTIHNQVMELLQAKGLVLEGYGEVEVIKLIRLAREGRAEEVILMLGMIQGTIAKLKAEVRRLEAELEEETT